MRFCFRLFLLILLAGLVSPAPAAEMSVQIRNGQIRSTPNFLGKIVAPVEYGDRVTIVEEQGGWIQVTTPDGKTGWIHNSALTKKKVTLKAGQGETNTGASGDELALAGKGFNSDVEAEFKAQNKDVDFSWVDRMESWKVDPPEMQRFLKEGGVKTPEGGAQ